MPRPIRATISESAFRQNQAVARHHAGGARIWSVVKANAYGHGLERAARALREVADGFAVLDFSEAILLREIGIRQPILMLEGFFQADDILPAAEHGLTPVIHCEEQIELLARAPLPCQLPVYLKVNSGMNRLGFAPARLRPAWEALRALAHVGRITLMTHFADADMERGIDDQLASFTAARELADAVSLANSAALVRYPKRSEDWVRPGILLYGASPCPRRASAHEIGLRPVMTLFSEIIAIQTLRPGERVGYGGLFRAEHPTRVGIVACGYADGYPRHAETGTPILVAGRRTRTLGRVSMDMIAADLTDLLEAGIGSPVVLWGEGLPADDVAEAAGTISYELFCGLSARVPVVEVD